MAEIFRRNAAVFDAPLDDTVLILNAATSRYHGLNAAAGLIWGLLANPVSASDIVQHLTDEYDVSREECEVAVVAFLEQLRDRELVTVQ